MPQAFPFALLLALAPAVMNWWMGRQLARRLDDPAFPELLLAQGQRLAKVTLGGIILLGLFFGEQWYWSLPVLLVALLASRYPLRRLLFGEQWSLGAYLRFGIFSTIGGFGLWFSAAFMPVFVLAVTTQIFPGDDHRRAAEFAAVLGAIGGLMLLLWQWHYAALWRALHRATPISETAPATLLARFDEVLERAGAALARRPAIYRYGAPGGYVMNAVAIPSLHSPAVAFGDTLLATLTEDEIVAVFAHEVAHHEQFTPRRLRRAMLLTVVIVALSAALPPWILLTIPAWAMVLALSLPLGLTLALGRRAAKSRADETASDRRAVTLTGNPAAVASALRKLHVYSRVPRRWPHDFERVASHPSLARRIQAIEDQGAVPATPLDAPTAVFSEKPGNAVVFEDSRVHWFEGVPENTPLELTSLRDSASSYRAIAYRDLTELRVAAIGAARVLKATDRDGKSWIVPIRAADVQVVQSALDVVDVRLGNQSPSAQKSIIGPRLLAGLLLLSLAVAGELGLMLLPLALLALRPERTIIVASGVMAIARALLAFTSLGVGLDAQQIAAGVAAAAGGLLIYLDTRHRRRAESATVTSDPDWRSARFTLGAIALMAALPAMALLSTLSRPSASTLDLSMMTSLLTSVLGLGACLAVFPARRWRVGGISVGAGAFAAIVGLSGDGWLYHRPQAIEWNERVAQHSFSIPIDGNVSRVELSPAGAIFAVQQTVVTRGDRPATRFRVGRVPVDSTSGPSVLVHGAAVEFLDDESALVLDAPQGDSVQLFAQRFRGRNGERVLSIDTLWRRRLPPLDDPQLFVDRERGEWRIVGSVSEDGQIVIINGSATGDTVGTRTLPHAARTMRPIAAFSNGTVLAPAVANETQSSDESFSTVLAGLTSFGWQWEVARIGGASREVVGALAGFPTCGSVVSSDAVLCTELGRQRARIWRAPAAGKLVRVADLPRGYEQTHVMDGRRFALTSRYGSKVAVLDVGSRTGSRLDLREPVGRMVDRWISDAAWAGDRVAVLSYGRGGSRLAIYRLAPKQ